MPNKAGNRYTVKALLISSIEIETAFRIFSYTIKWQHGPDAEGTLA
jgi:hypothetical protein